MPSGIAFLGDESKIAATGKKRISDISNEKGNVVVKVIFADGETSVNLNGYSKHPVYSNKGDVKYNPQTQLFSLILPSEGMREVTVILK